MVTIVLGLLTASFFASTSLMSSRSVKVIGSGSSLAWTMLVGLVITVPFAVVSGVPTNLGSSAPWMVAAGLGNVVGILLAGFALRVGKVGVVAPILATGGAISALISALLGESIAPLVAFLLLVIVGGIVLSAVAPDPAPLAHERPVYVVMITSLAALCLGVGLFATGNISDDLPLAWVLLPARLVGVLLLLLPLILAGRLRLTRATAPLVIAMGFTEVLGFVCFAIGAESQLAVMSVFASQFAPIAAIAAYVLFKERLGALQIAGIVVIVAGVSALSVTT
ncbi:MAG: EamA family transporter [Candidatus Nanopelagicales bacterium]|nr:EamA family transporter [Candidatus Nanopelagicales bacterium]MDP5094763.1 EamA family transporter [Candidatus Nanopelagicales bacterium]